MGVLTPQAKMAARALLAFGRHEGGLSGACQALADEVGIVSVDAPERVQRAVGIGLGVIGALWDGDCDAAARRIRGAVEGFAEPVGDAAADAAEPVTAPD